MSADKTIYLFANWKMYLDYDESNILANALADKLKKIPVRIKMAVFPSALSFYPVTQTLNDIKIGTGSQNAYWVDKGGYTGEISLAMYKNSGAKYALIGHSERRHLFYENNHDVRQKMEEALNLGLTPVVCVGETEKERREGKTEEIIEVQLRAALENLSWPAGRELVVAYEPVWAIGTGLACDSTVAEEVHKKISGWISSLISGIIPVLLYGGSVRGNNVADYLKQEHIHGVLVGGASAKFDSWLEIVQNAEQIIK